MPDGKVFITGSDYQVDIGSAQNVNSAKCILIWHQTIIREAGAN